MNSLPEKQPARPGVWIESVESALAETDEVLAACIHTGSADPRTALMAIMILQDAFSYNARCGAQLSCSQTEKALIGRWRKRRVTRYLVLGIVVMLWCLCVAVYGALHREWVYVVLNFASCIWVGFSWVRLLKLRRDLAWIAGGTAQP